MSGGCYNYFCWKMDELDGEFKDKELDDLWQDMKKITKELEWWQSCDTEEKTYRRAVAKFKDKWFGQSREDRLKKYIDEKMAESRRQLLLMMGLEEESKDV